MENAVEFIAHISTKPWSDYTQADYTLQQWHDACLIHNHDGQDYTKGDCKLPVRTPNGALNKYGVFAAAAALDGARRPIDATPQQKLDAAKKLVGYYKEINSQPPKAMMAMIDRMMHFADVGEFLEHHGVKGMRWGVRREGDKFRHKIQSSSSAIYNDAAKAMNEHIKRINNKPEYKNMDFTKNSPTREKYYNEFAVTFAGELDKALIKRVGGTSAKGNWHAQFLVDKTNGQPYLRVFHNSQPLLVAKHDTVDTGKEEFRIDVKLSSTGHIIGFSVPNDNLMQSDDVGEFLSHYGIRGMHWGIRHKPVKKGRSAPRTSADFKATAHLRGRKASELSNNQLKKLNERLNLEQNYNRLNPTTVKRGHGKVKAIIGAVGAGVGLYNTLNSPGGKFAIAQARKFLGKSIKSGVSTIGQF